MTLLVDHLCRSSGTTIEHWMSRPIASSTPCRCGAVARRRFGAPDLIRATSGRADPSTRAPDATGGLGHSCAEHAAAPGSCVRRPTATRVLSARARGDGRALDAELTRQQQAIAAGTLDPAAPVTTASPAHPITTGVGGAQGGQP